MIIRPAPVFAFVLRGAAVAGAADQPLSPDMSSAALYANQILNLFAPGHILLLVEPPLSLLTKTLSNRTIDRVAKVAYHHRRLRPHRPFRQ